MNKYAKGDKVRIRDLECIPRELVGKIVTIKDFSHFRGYYDYDFEEYDIGYCSESCLELVKIGENNDLLNGIVNEVVNILNEKYFKDKER